MEGPWLKIHNCNELPSVVNLHEDPDCLDQVNTIFDVERWMGEGQYGMVMRLGRKEDVTYPIEQIAVKVSPVSEVELRVACKMNAARQETPIFLFTYGWLLCKEIPERWKAITNITERRHSILRTSPVLFTFMQPVEHKWFDIPYVIDHRYRTCLFILLHGLWVARSRFNFHHGDLHGGNIMLQRVKYAKDVKTTFRYGEIEASVYVEFMPRLIDYGYASTKTYKSDRDFHKTDLEMLRQTFDDRFESDSEAYGDVAFQEQKAFYAFLRSPEWKNAESNPDADSMLPLFSHSYFDVPEIQRHQVKRHKSIEARCFTCCSSNVKFQINHKISESKHFCHENCYKKMQGICRFIK